MKQPVFYDAAGHGADDLYLLAARGEPGEWCGIYKTVGHRRELIREFRDEWIVSIDSGPFVDLAAISDEGRLFLYSGGRWEVKDLNTSYGLTKVRVSASSVVVVGARGLVWQTDGARTVSATLSRRSRILGVFIEKDGVGLAVVGEGGLWATGSIDRFVEDRIGGVSRLCDVVRGVRGDYWVCGAGGAVFRRTEGDWQVVSNSAIAGTVLSLALLRDDAAVVVAGGDLWMIDLSRASVERLPESGDHQVWTVRQLRDGTVVSVDEDGVVIRIRATH